MTSTTTEEWGDWIGYNGGGCPDECVGKCIEICTTDSGKSLERRASITRWLDKIVAYRIKREPVVKVWTGICSADAEVGNELLVYECDTGSTPLKITLTETDGDRAWSIEEVSS